MQIVLRLCRIFHHLSEISNTIVGLIGLIFCPQKCDDFQAIGAFSAVTWRWSSFFRTSFRLCLTTSPKHVFPLLPKVHLYINLSPVATKLNPSGSPKIYCLCNTSVERRTAGAPDGLNHTSQTFAYSIRSGGIRSFCVIARAGTGSCRIGPIVFPGRMA